MHKRLTNSQVEELLHKNLTQGLLLATDNHFKFANATIEHCFFKKLLFILQQQNHILLTVTENCRITHINISMSEKR